MASQLERPILVLDSWPILEWIQKREPAFGRFRLMLQQTVAQQTSFEMTRINYGEVIYTIRKSPDMRNRDDSLRMFLDIPIRLHSIDDALVDEAVELKSRFSFSYADAFAAALAIRLNVELVTGDKEFRILEAGRVLKLRWVGA